MLKSHHTRLRRILLVFSDILSFLIAFDSSFCCSSRYLLMLRGSFVRLLVLTCQKEIMNFALYLLKGWKKYENSRPLNSMRWFITPLIFLCSFILDIIFDLKRIFRLGFYFKMMTLKWEMMSRFDVCYYRNSSYFS